MSELRIDRLRVRIANAAGHEPRLELIARQAATLLAERLARRLAGGLPAAPAGAADLVAERVDVNLAEMSDAAAADRIASAWFTVLTPAAGSGRSSDSKTGWPTDLASATSSHSQFDRRGGGGSRPSDSGRARPSDSGAVRLAGSPADSLSGSPSDRPPGSPSDRPSGSASDRVSRSGPARSSSPTGRRS